MPETVSALLVLLVLLQVKHMIADFFLQTRRMLTGRGEYLHLGRAQHAGVHAIGSILVFLVMGTSLTFAVIVAAVEWAVHFNIDYGKARYCDKRDLQHTQAMYWYAMGFDQFLHQLTYLAMGWAWATYAI